MKEKEGEAEQIRAAFMSREIHPEVQNRVNAAVSRAARAGEKELMAFSFPASYCNDGGWRSEEGPDVDTCFALLFLRRANLTRDLSTAMRGVKDPGQATLKATGIGASSLVGPGWILS